MKLLPALLLVFLTISCSDPETVEPSRPDDAVLYFPPIDDRTWETTTPASLGWDESKLAELYSFLENNDTRAFILLKDGKIVSEKYWGKDLLERFDFDSNSQWYWASAGKSLTSVLTGIAQDKGLLSVDDATQDYLGVGWTSMPAGQESRISIRNQLSMNTGLDFTNGNLSCTDPACLNYKSDPATEWYYYNAPYTS
ncbi:serine hydrolase [Nonlabens agnitus]|uniref:Beta-lactamase-related domain-containing protein n=1 Tax=Nonlabens agnitus TaxID=870484 RepID=A0A2S9WTM0_9FLAO|nr:serine hydrolase [Nonlabens agnitus]PRP66843.1 hypothetical protein BST86_06865 [Nonlabens agnitus]